MVIIQTIAKYLQEHYSDILTVEFYEQSPEDITLFYLDKTIIGAITYIEKGHQFPNQTILITLYTPQRSQARIQISDPNLLPYITQKLDNYKNHLYFELANKATQYIK